MQFTFKKIVISLWIIHCFGMIYGMHVSSKKIYPETPQPSNPTYSIQSIEINKE